MMMDTATTLSLAWRPYFPPAVVIAGLALLLGLAALVCVRAFRAHPILSTTSLLMRSAWLTMIGLLLMGPSTVGPASINVDRPSLTVMLDSSASMQTRDMDSASRYDFAVEHWLDPAYLLSLRNRYKVELVTFDQAPRVTSEESLRQSAESAADAPVSNVARSVSEVVSRLAASRSPDQTGSAVVVLSDGRDTLSEPMRAVGQLAHNRSVPIYTVTLGGPSLIKDVALVAVPQQPYLFVDEPGRINVRVAQSGAGRSRTTLHVENQGGHQTYPIDFDARDSVTVEIPVRHDEPGTYAYRVWVDPIPGEAERANNAQPVFLEVTAKRLRVLMLEGRPYWDTKFLAQSLRKDSRLELTQITQISPSKRETIVSQPAAREELPQALGDLAYYDVIILGKGINHVLPIEVIELLPDYVSGHGGRVVFARGRAYDIDAPEGERASQALSVIEPVVFGVGQRHRQQVVFDHAWPTRPGMSPSAGLAGDNTADQPLSPPPSLLSLPVVTKEKASAKVLARTRALSADGSPGQPAIVSMPYGRGEVVAVLGEGLWTWGLRPGRAEGPGEIKERLGWFDRFWSDTVMRLALGSGYQPGRVVSLRLSRLSVQAGDTLSLDLISRVRFDALDARVYVVGPGGDRYELSAKPIDDSTTRYRAVLTPRTPGVHRVVVETPLSPGKPIETRFNSYDVDLERLQSAANPSAMRALSDSSGGRCLPPDDPETLIGLLDRYRASVKTPAQPKYVWGRAWVMILVLGLTGGEWVLRRSGGLA